MGAINPFNIPITKYNRPYISGMSRMVFDKTIKFYDWCPDNDNKWHVYETDGRGFRALCSFNSGDFKVRRVRTSSVKIQLLCQDCYYHTKYVMKYKMGGDEELRKLKERKIVILGVNIVE